MAGVAGAAVSSVAIAETLRIPLKNGKTMPPPDERIVIAKIEIIRAIIVPHLRKFAITAAATIMTVAITTAGRAAVMNLSAAEKKWLNEAIAPVFGGKGAAVRPVLLLSADIICFERSGLQCAQ